MWNLNITHSTTQSGYWHAQAIKGGTTLTDAGVTNVGASLCTIGFSRTVPTGLREDRATITVAIAKDPGGSLYSYLGSPDKATVETALNTWWTSLKALISNQWSLVEYRWHDWAITEPLLGPADKTTTLAVSGTAGTATRMPDQDAGTMTFVTPSRRHWGRVYLPGLAQANYDMSYGRFNSTNVDTVSGYWHTFLGSLASAGLEQVVPSRKYQALLSLSELHMDDVVDIVRRRRAKQPNYRKVYTS